ncbi:sulfate ABC transporter permease subunit CysW [bacterium]|jgi:sulfate/thiosulfate transport system permease protein|nr:sulfate ABC transporter permease subunit CysW [bacterium]
MSANHASLSSSIRQDPWWARAIMILLAIGFLTWLVLIPVVFVFVSAWSNGASSYVASLLEDEETRSSILLTLMVAPVAVVLNVLFGLAAAWAIARFRFRGRAIVIAMIDLPFAVSPVVAGLSLLLIFGQNGFLGPWLHERGWQVVFAFPGILLATCFVTLPFVARELIPLMESIGDEEELAAVSLGASPFQMFWRVTVPNIKWGILYGAILCNARAMGEFGAVSVVSGRIPGETETMPLRVERLFQDYDSPGSFAVASVLTLLALVTLGIKIALERQTRADLARHQRMADQGESA